MITNDGNQVIIDGHDLIAMTYRYYISNKQIAQHAGGKMCGRAPRAGAQTPTDINASLIDL